MELLQLRYFCDAAVTENFSKTARKYDVPVSGISQSVKRLEDELSLALFVRHSNKIKLSADGALFFEKISKALSLIDEAVALTESNPVEGKICICINSNRRIVMQAIEKFRRLYPSIDIITKYGAEPESEDFDLVISGERLQSRAVNTLLFSEEILLAVPSTWSIANEQELTAELLRAQPFIAMGETNSLTATAKQLCGKLGFKPHIAIQTDDPFYLRRCVELGLGLAFVPALSWRGQFSDSIVLRSLGNHRRSTYVSHADSSHLPHRILLFLELLKNECDAEARI